MRLTKHLEREALLLVLANALAAPLAAQPVQQGGKLTAADASLPSYLGSSVAISADGNTALVGGYMDNSNQGAAWVFTRANGVWTQQGHKLVGSGGAAVSYQGIRVSLSGDGNTAIVGGDGDDGGVGAAWIFTRSGTVWAQPCGKLIAGDAVGNAAQGFSVALSSDGNTALLGGYADDNFLGAAWVWIRTADGLWTEQAKLVGSGFAGPYSGQGFSLALSSDGNTALVGAWYDDYNAGAAWVFTRDSTGAWTQQGPKLVGTGAIGEAQQGWSVALSSDGNTALVHGAADDGFTGAAWVFQRSNGVWTQQGDKLVGTGLTGLPQQVDQGAAAALSSDGTTAAFGRANDNGSVGAVWTFSLDAAGAWTQLGQKLIGNPAAPPSYQGYSVAISADGTTLVEGAPADANDTGALWVFTAPPAGPQISVSGVLNAATLQQGGIAPNEYISIFGVGLGPTTGVSSPMTPSLGGTVVYVDDMAAPLIYSQAGQVNLLVPWGVAGAASTTIQVEFNGVEGNAVTVPLVDSSPGVFTQAFGPGQAWVLNQDLVFNSSAHPAARNTYITFWLTGQGLVSIAQQDGEQPVGPPFPTPELPVSVTIGGVQVPPANLTFAGLIYSGEVQLNVLIPENVPTGGAVPLIVTIGNASSRHDATIAID